MVKVVSSMQKMKNESWEIASSDFSDGTVNLLVLGLPTGAPERRKVRHLSVEER